MHLRVSLLSLDSHKSPLSQSSIDPDMNMQLFVRDESENDNGENNFEDVDPELAEDPEDAED